MDVIRIVNSLYTSNTYLIHHEDHKEAWLIDAGDIEEVIKHLPPEKYIQGSFITHAHNDHIYGLNKLIQLYPECVIYASEYAREGLYSDKLNLSFYREEPFIFEGSSLKVIDKSFSLQLYKNTNIEVFETPGHNWGSLSFLIDNYLFTGDSFIPNYDVVTKLKGGDKKEAQRSLGLLHSMMKPGVIVCPGHETMVYM